MLIALLTDFGIKDYFVAAMKGTILQINPNAKIVDITHEIPPQNLNAASFTLRSCYENFPAQTIFVVVVDPGVGSGRKAILVETEKYRFIAPDNGLLSFVFDEPGKFTVFELTNELFFAEKVSRTFHGRDVFAPVAAHLSSGIKANEFGTVATDFIQLPNSVPRKLSASKIEAEIIFIDRFGNLVTNLKQSDLPENFTLEINGKSINKLNAFYSQAAGSELFMIVGSASYLEIAAFRNSAKEILSVEIGEKVLLRTH